MSTSREAGQVPRCTDGKRLVGPVGARHQGPPLVHVPGIPCIVLLGFCTVKTFASKNTVSEFFRCYLGAYETKNIRGVHIKCAAVSVQMCVFELGIVSVGWEQVWLGRRCSLKALRPGSARWVPSQCPPDGCETQRCWQPCSSALLGTAAQRWLFAPQRPLSGAAHSVDIAHQDHR